MINRSTRIGLPIVFLLTTSFCTGSVLADWAGKTPKGYYNQGYGDFPPSDIDQRLLGHLNTDDEAETSKPQEEKTTSSATIDLPVSNPVVSNPVQTYSAQNYSVQNQQNARQPAYGRYDRGRNITSPGMSPGMQRHIRNRNKHLSERRNKRGSGFSGPWDNRSSGFSGPWNNRGSGFSGPWDNRGSGFSGPWNNRGSGFSGPWDNRGSGFSAPWSNNRSGFSPFGNGGSWSW